MKKIILIEDIIQIATEIKAALNSFEVNMFHNSKSFLEELRKPQFKEFLTQTDFFILDFNLGDGTLISSNIYEYILANKKNEGILCCISSFGQQIVDKNCEHIAVKYNRQSPFDYYMKKKPGLISEFIINNSLD